MPPMLSRRYTGVVSTCDIRTARRTGGWVSSLKMATLHLLGTGAVVTDSWRTTTMLALDNGHSLVLVDCGGDAVQRVLAAGLDPLRVRRLIITHEHADHCGGFPLLMEKLWVHGLRGDFHVHGIPSALSQARRVHDAFDTSDWPGYPTVIYHEVPYRAGSIALDDGEWLVRTAPGVHPVPCVGLHFTDLRSGATAFYSADTEPAEEIARWASGVPLLVHEATGEGPGHSSALQAARVASRSGSRRLVLVHLPPEGEARAADLAAARQVFADTELAEEGGSVVF